MAKTYLPTLRIMVRGLTVYMSRWQTLIEAGLTPTQVTAFRDCLTCLISLASALGVEPVVE